MGDPSRCVMGRRRGNAARRGARLITWIAGVAVGFEEPPRLARLRAQACPSYRCATGGDEPRPLAAQRWEGWPRKRPGRFLEPDAH